MEQSGSEYVLYSNKGKHEWLDLDTYCLDFTDTTISRSFEQCYMSTAIWNYITSENADQFVEKWKKR